MHSERLVDEIRAKTGYDEATARRIAETSLSILGEPDTDFAVELERSLRAADHLRGRGELISCESLERELCHCSECSPVTTPIPDPYKSHLEKLRAATASPEQKFEDRWKTERQAAFDAEYERFAEHRDDPPPQLRSADDFPAPPNPYAIGIKALKDKMAAPKTYDDVLPRRSR